MLKYVPTKILKVFSSTSLTSAEDLTTQHATIEDVLANRLLNSKLYTKKNIFNRARPPISLIEIAVKVSVRRERCGGAKVTHYFSSVARVPLEEPRRDPITVSAILVRPSRTG